MKKNILKGVCAALLAGAVLNPALLAAEQDDFAAQLAKLVAGRDDSAYFSQIRLAVGSNQMEVDGRKIQLDTEPELVRGRLMLPLRAVAQAAGAQVEYEAATQTAVVSSPYGDEIRCPLAGAALSVNDQARQMDAPSYVKQGRTYLSAQALEQALELEITQDETTITITAPYQTGRVVVVLEPDQTLDRQLLEQAGLKPEAAIHDGQGMWVLQFTTPAQARQAAELLAKQGLTAEPDLYEPPIQDGEGEKAE